MNDNWAWSSYLGYDLRTDIEDIERIEVVRGPGSVLYGTGAVSGVVNLVTRPHDAQTGYEVGASATDGTVGRGRVRAAYDFGGGAGMWTSVQASHSSGTSYDLPAYTGDPLTRGITPTGADRFNAGTWTGEIWWKALSVQWSVNSHNKHLPAGQFETILGDDRTQQTDTRAMVEAKLDAKASKNLESVTSAHLDYCAYDGTFAAIPEIGGLAHEAYTGEWTGAEQRFVYTPWSALRVTAGGELQYHFKADQTASSQYPAPATYLDDHHTFEVGAGYGVADVTLTRALRLSLGGRYDAYSTFGGSFNPRAAVIVKPYEGGNLKVMFGKAFRAPSIYELYFMQPGVQLPGLHLQAESMYSGEVEYSHRFTPSVVGLVTAYDNVASNLIELAPDASCQSCTRYVNTSMLVAVAGAEAELRKEWRNGWQVSASYSFAHPVFLKDGSLQSVASLAQDPTRRQVPNAPQHMASLRGAAPILGRALMATTRVSFTSGRYDVHDVQSTAAAPQPAQTETSPALLWDLVLCGQEPRFHVRYSLGMYNLLGWTYSLPVSNEFFQPNGTSLGTLVQAGRTVMAAAYVDF